MRLISSLIAPQEPINKMGTCNSTTRKRNTYFNNRWHLGIQVIICEMQTSSEGTFI